MGGAETADGARFDRGLAKADDGFEAADPDEIPDVR